MKVLQILLAGILLFVVLTVLAFVYLQWWQALIVVLALIIAIVLGVKFILRNLGRLLADGMMKMFEAKSQVLRGAEATVHAVEPTTAPPRGEDCEPDEPREPAMLVNYYRIEVTIRPVPVTGSMSHWDVDDLRVVPFDTPAASLKEMSADDFEAIDGYCLEQVKIQENGQFVDDQQSKHEGEKRLSFVTGVTDHVKALKFQYYGEQFGRIELPPALPKLV